MTKTNGKPTLFIVAGPNGAGKTTYAFAHIAKVAGSTEFINLDEIARGLSPLDPQKAKQRAARVALDMMRTFITQGKTFTIETTLSGRTHLRTIESARAAGFKIVLLYFAPQTPEICLARIARRVSEGGHDVPEADVRRRFARSAANLPHYAERAGLWRIFDVSCAKVSVIAEGAAGSLWIADGALASALEEVRLPETVIQWLRQMQEMARGER